MADLRAALIVLAGGARPAPTFPPGVCVERRGSLVTVSRPYVVGGPPPFRYSTDDEHEAARIAHNLTRSTP